MCVLQRGRAAAGVWEAGCGACICAPPASQPTPHPSPHTPARLVAVLERRAFVYDLESLALLGTLDTPPNPLGLAGLTQCHSPACLLALPAEGSGAVRVYDAAARVGAGAGSAGSGIDVLCELQAHKAAVVSGLVAGGWGLFQRVRVRSCLPARQPASCQLLPTPLPACLQTVMAFDDEGTLLATASKKGTVVRVHAVRRSEEHALEFRRGSMPATITALAFSPPAVTPRLLCCASDHGTIHIFALQGHGRWAVEAPGVGSRQRSPLTTPRPLTLNCMPIPVTSTGPAFVQASSGCGCGVSAAGGHAGRAGAAAAAGHGAAAGQGPHRIHLCGAAGGG